MDLKPLEIAGMGLMTRCGCERELREWTRIPATDALRSGQNGFAAVALHACVLEAAVFCRFRIRLPLPKRQGAGAFQNLAAVRPVPGKNRRPKMSAHFFIR
jgi:hypothetical protein